MTPEQLVVVGGGTAGCTAAIEAARRGVKVMLVDEHPQSVSSMSFDAPYFYGSRLPAVLSDSSAIADRVLGSNPLLLECLDADVNVITSTCVWGNFVPGPNNLSSKERRVGLADAERSWLVPYEHLILAPGARDLVLSFPGWQLPGVLGSAAACVLQSRYQALGATRVVILGSGNVGLELAQQLLQSGLDVAGIVDVSRTIRGDAVLAERLKAARVPILLSTVIEAALGDSELKAIQLRSVDENMELLPNSARTIECDTLCLAFGLVPNIELAAQTGCQLEYCAARGGWLPIVDADMRTSIPYIHVIGDGAGLSESSRTDTASAIAQARCAAQAIAEGKRAETVVSLSPRNLEVGSAPLTSANEWLRALTAAGGLDVVVCQCEDVTRRDVLGVRAPRYLNAPDERRAGTVTSLNCSSQDFVKRMTRAGMGHCQGKRCRDQTALLLASQCADSRLENIVTGTFRAPVRPLPLNVVAGEDQSEEIRLHWPSWFQPLNEGEIT